MLIIFLQIYIISVIQKSKPPIVIYGKGDVPMNLKQDTIKYLIRLLKATEKMFFGQRVMLCRLALGVKETSLAWYIGVPVNELKRIETVGYIPNSNVVYLIARYFNIYPKNLFYRFD